MGDTKSFGGMVALATKALSEGGRQLSPSHFEWDVSGFCQSPITHEIAARPDTKENPGLHKLPVEWREPFRKSGLLPNVPAQGGYHWRPGLNGMIWVSLTVRCRRCDWCLRQRAILWANKARSEIELASRTWFATYTGSPDEHFRWECVARDAESRGPVPFEALSDIAQFRARCAAASPDITRYVKRIRKQSGAPLRYLFVAERHETGFPHWHALVHEVDPAKPIRKAVLKEQWPHGFTRFKLVENAGAAWYLCKYLSKDLATRVRSSLKYGRHEVLTTLVDKNNESYFCETMTQKTNTSVF